MRSLLSSPNISDLIPTNHMEFEMSKMKNSPLTHHRNTNSSSSTSNIGSHSTNTSNITVKIWEVITYMLIFFFNDDMSRIPDSNYTIIPIWILLPTTIHHINERRLSNIFKILKINSSLLTFLFLLRRRRSMVTWIILLLPYYILVLQGIAIIVAIHWATVSFYCFRCIISSWRDFRRSCQLYSENGT